MGLVTDLEIALAQKTPVMQAEHCMDDRSPLSFYDCLVPKLREHRRYLISKDSKFSVADFKVQYKLKKIE